MISDKSRFFDDRKTFLIIDDDDDQRMIYQEYFQRIDGVKAITVASIDEAIPIFGVGCMGDSIDYVFVDFNLGPNEDSKSIEKFCHWLNKMNVPFSILTNFHRDYIDNMTCGRFKSIPVYEKLDDCGSFDSFRNLIKMILQTTLCRGKTVAGLLYVAFGEMSKGIVV